MSYQVAYTTRFRSLDNTLYEIEIVIDGYQGRALEICLEGDEPCVIEWQETGKTDVVQSSTCTLRVSNESDRQMVMLMGAANALCQVNRNGKPYWIGHLDDAVYEEPYSFNRAYVTELIFSDFGILNRIPFDLTGKQSVGAIVRDCLVSAGFVDGNGTTILLYTSLLETKTQQPITLDMLYINADRFEPDSDSWDEKTTKREVLEEILRPLGLRIMQKNGQIYIYDIEYIRDHENMHNYVVWKGTDAFLKGSETFGWYELAFDTGFIDTIAEAMSDAGKWASIIPGKRFYARKNDSLDACFYIELNHVEATAEGCPFRTLGHLTPANYTGHARRVKCWDTVIQNSRDLLASATPTADWVAMTELQSGFLPLAPDKAREAYRLKISLDFLLSAKLDPFDNDTTSQNTFIKWKDWKDNLTRVYVPVKLELLDESGNIILHYCNTGEGGPLDPGQGNWKTGEASFDDMMLAYYTDNLNETALDGWATNRPAIKVWRDKVPSLLAKMNDGEYAVLPPQAGRLRLTVSNGVKSYNKEVNDALLEFDPCIRWQAYRNLTVSVVRIDDESDNGTVYERDMINLLGNRLGETVMACTWQNGVAPLAQGLLFAADGTVLETFTKDGKEHTLAKHRLRCLQDQTAQVQPVLTGTAELDVQMCAKREYCTPGVFLVTALRQDLHEDTEELTMARIANVGGFVYEFTWSDSYCVEEEEPYSFVWSSPVCVQEPGPYEFAWSNPTCVKQYSYSLEWEEM